MTFSNKTTRTTLADLSPALEEVPIERLRFVSGGDGGGTSSSTHTVTHNGANGDTLEYVIDPDGTSLIAF